MRLHDRQRGAKRLVGSTTNYNIPHRPPTLHGGGTTYAPQCNAVQFSSHPMTGHVVATCDLCTTASRTHTSRVDQQAGPSGPIPIGRTGTVCAPFFLLSFVWVVLFWRIWGRRRCDTPTMPPIRAMPGVGNGSVAVHISVGTMSDVLVVVSY